MLFAIENLPYWIFLCLGLALFLLTLLSQAKQAAEAPTSNIASLTQTVLETGPGSDAVVEPDARRRPIAPFPLRMALTLTIWGLLGWLFNICIGTFLGAAPIGPLGFGVVTMTLILSLIISHQLVSPLGWIISSRRNQSSLDYLVGCTGKVDQDQINRLAAGEITQIEVVDAQGSTLFVGAVLPAWFQVTPQPGDRLTLIERLEQGQVYHVVVADSSDQDDWLKRTAAIR